jgi:predicted permease
MDPGFRPEHVLVANINFRQSGFPQQRHGALHHEIAARLAALPGVISAAEAAWAPISSTGWNEAIRVNGTTRGDSNLSRVGPGYFTALGTPLIAGRDFSHHDTPSAPSVAIVNEQFARQFFGKANPIGRTFQIVAPADEGNETFQVIGLVRNSKYLDLREDFGPIAFLSATQERNPGTSATYLLRTQGPPDQLTATVKQTLAAVHPLIGVEFRVLGNRIQDTLVRERLMAALSLAFGALASLLAVLGLYGVIAYMVARRRNEIGIRMALGADRARILSLILRDAGRMVIAGLAAGLLLTLWAGQAVSSLLFGLKPGDPVILSGATCTLAAVALIASYLPARRAAGIDPTTALRQE